MGDCVKKWLNSKIVNVIPVLNPLELSLHKEHEKNIF